MKRNYLLVLLIAITSLSTVLHAQQVQRYKIALFAPLYLDSAFDVTGSYNFNKTFPKFINPGLDFYQGAQAAFDSLSKRGAPLEVFVYDLRSTESTLPEITRKPEFNDMDMIIGHTNVTETRVLAELARNKKIPFISANLPNDAGTTNNPYFVMLNSTLQSHVEGIYKLLQKNFNLERIVVFRKTGPQEDQLKNYLIEAGKTTAGVPVKIKYVDLPVNFTSETLKAQLDSNSKTICIAGSLDEGFGVKLAQSLAGLNKKFPVTLIGMPTWESVNFGKPAAGLDILYSTPFYYSKAAPLEIRLSNYYESTVNGKPNDLFFRGYEAALRFSLLLLDAKNDVASNLTRKGNNVFTQYDIQPVFKNKKTMTLDYFENKHLYFMKLNSGNKSLFSW